MPTFLTFIGFAACVVAASFAVAKVIDAVFFFQTFRDEITKSLADIEKNLRNLKP